MTFLKRALVSSTVIACLCAAAAFPALAAATSMRLDPASVRTLSLLKSTTLQAAARDGKVACFVGSTWNFDEYHRIALTCDPTLRTGRVLRPERGHLQAMAIDVAGSNAYIAGCRSTKRSAKETKPFLMRVSAAGGVDPTLRYDVPALDIVATQLKRSSVCIHSVEVLADERIIVSGSAVQPGSAQYESWIARLKPNGKLDKTFGTNGITVPQVPDSNSTVMSRFVVLADGRVLVIGQVRVQVEGKRVRLPAALLLTANGAPDATFGASGVYLNSTVTGTGSFSSVARMQDGSRPSFPIAVSGSYNQDLKLRPLVARLSADGTLMEGHGTGVDSRLPATSVATDEELRRYPMTQAADGIVTIASQRYTTYDFDSFVTQLDATDTFDVTSRPFAGIEPIDTRVGQVDYEFVSDVLPSPTTQTIVGGAYLSGRWVGQVFTAKQAAMKPTRAVTLTVTNALRQGSSKAGSCGLSPARACIVRASSLARIYSTIRTTRAPAFHPRWAGAVVRVHTLTSAGIGSSTEASMALVRTKTGWDWSLRRRLKAGRYFVTVHRNAGTGTGAIESRGIYITSR